MCAKIYGCIKRWCFSRKVTCFVPYYRNNHKTYEFNNVYLLLEEKNKHVICEKITFQNGPFYFISFFLVLPQKPNIFTPTYYIVLVLGAPGITFFKKSHQNTFSQLSKPTKHAYWWSLVYIHERGLQSTHPYFGQPVSAEWSTRPQKVKSSPNCGQLVPKKVKSFRRDSKFRHI